MRPTRYIASSKQRPERGHTLLELMVAMGMSLGIAAMISAGLRFQSDIYLTDVGRKRVQQNLRGALDIIAMNVRQAGEGFDSLFPAVVLSQSAAPLTSVLTLRRKILHEVLPLCKAAANGATQVFISDDASVDAKCLPDNIAASLDAWRAQRTSEGAPLRIYIYDRVAFAGEFLDYSNEGVDTGDDFLTISATHRAYPTESTNLYVLEEYQFSLDTPNQTLQLQVDGHTDATDDVAYNVSAFSVSLRRQDDTTITSLQPGDNPGWQKIRAVLVSMTGTESWRHTATTRSLAAEYFPRNVLSK